MEPLSRTLQTNVGINTSEEDVYCYDCYPPQQYTTSYQRDNYYHDDHYATSRQLPPTSSHHNDTVREVLYLQEQVKLLEKRLQELQSQSRTREDYSHNISPVNSLDLTHHDCNSHQRPEYDNIYPVLHTHQPRHYDEPRPSIPYFFGKPNEWESFWMKFEILCKRYRWDGINIRDNLILCMRGDAASFTTNLSYSIRSNTRFFIKALKERFSHRIPTRTYRAKLENIQECPKENIQEYASKIQIMMSKAYADIVGTTTYAELAIEYLLKGLQDKRMAYEISIRTPRTISEAVDMIIHHQASKDSFRRRNHVSSSTTDHQQKPSELRRLNRKRFITEERFSKFARELTQSLQKEKSTLDDHTYSKEKVVKKVCRPKMIKTLICHHCYKVGHIAPKCQEKKNIQSEPKQEKVRKERLQKKHLNFNGLSLQAKSQSKH